MTDDERPSPGVPSIPPTKRQGLAMALRYLILGSSKDDIPPAVRAHLEAALKALGREDSLSTDKDRRT